MILGIDDITRILRDNPNRKYVEAIQKYDSHLTMHMTGLGLDKAIERFDYYEANRLLLLRQKYSPSNEDFYSRLHRPIDKVFNAKGGSVNYTISEADKKKLQQILANVKDGYSIRRWVETYFLPAYWYDPMGIILMEVGDDEVYPTYKCVQEVYDIPKPKGRGFDYIVFKTDRKIGNDNGAEGGTNVSDYQDTNKSMSLVGGKSGYYRVLDDKFDYLIKWDGGRATIIEDETYPNYFDTLPAVTVSNIWDNVKQFYISPDNDTIGIADQHLRSRSVLVMMELANGYPQRWQYTMGCPTCKGTGKVAASNCPSCNGTGVKSKNDVSEIIGIPFPRTKDDPIIAPNVAGNVEAPIASWQEMKVTIDRQYKEAHYCTWGTHQVEDSSQETATGRFIDVQPVNDRLGKYSDACEWIETWITDHIGEFNFSTSYKGCEINYGRRFLVEAPDVIWKKLEDAVKVGKMTYSSLKNIYMQWVDSEYSGDEMMRLKLVMEFKLDPAPFMSLQDAKNTFLDPQDFQKALYYPQWLESLPDNWYISANFETLVKMRDDYIKAITDAQDPLLTAIPDPNKQKQAA